MVAGIPGGDLFQPAVGRARRLSEVAGSEQWPAALEAECRGRWQLSGSGVPDLMGRPEIAALRHPHLRSSGHAAPGRHHQVRPQLQCFGLLGASNTYSGGGSQESNRLDSTAKYLVSFSDLLHLGALYKFNGSTGSANTAFQANLGVQSAHASVDAYYSKVNSAITATSLTAAQVAKLPALGYPVSNSLAATISDNTAYALMASYKFERLKFFAGYEYIKYQNPKTPLQAGFINIGGYVLAFVNNTAYNNPKMFQVYWTGLRYRVVP